MKFCVYAVLLTIGCSSTISISPAPNQGPSLIPKGTAIALQPIEATNVILGKIAHIDAHRVILIATGNSGSPSTLTGTNVGKIQIYVRDEVLALYRRPSSRLGIGFLIGAVSGAALGAFIGAKLCDDGDLPGCDQDDYYRDGSDNKNLAKIAFGAIGALMMGVTGHSVDTGAQGTDPSDWVKIDWPE